MSQTTQKVLDNFIWWFPNSRYEIKPKSNTSLHKHSQRYMGIDIWERISALENNIPSVDLVVHNHWINQSCQQTVEIINIIEMMVINEHWLAYNLTQHRRFVNKTSLFSYFGYCCRFFHRWRLRKSKLRYNETDITKMTR